MTPVQLLAKLRGHANASVAQVEPRDCAQWAEVVELLIKQNAALAAASVKPEAEE